ncbi:MerR family DNA-binding transcriptional regulator [Corallincola holothuriorum]|uniref:MerR family DNA-binding transcriptional regulator n=1 Tax=Corallincola holothuriorum TaxID=2282215 RepID=A0A368NKA3_9GAMM|nr:MerR family transcriptional regulator [Corallincola holothuriorum]RCU51037.1 MerR family DNA-binding transcriptional regulator [Corallincola holothuriorum]
MKISEIADAAGLTVKSVRYYESAGLIPEPARGDNGYREYSESLLPTLRLISRARKSDFSVKECKELLNLFNNPDRYSADVHELVEKKITEIDDKILGLTMIREQLSKLADCCANNETPSCEILEQLSK